MYDDNVLPRLKFDSDLIVPISEGIDPLSLLFPLANIHKQIAHVRFIQIFTITSIHKTDTLNCFNFILPKARLCN